DREVEVVGQVAGVVDVADVVRQRARRRGYASDGVVDGSGLGDLPALVIVSRRRVVRHGDGDGQRRRRRGTGLVVYRIGERLGRGLALVQGLGVAVRVVERVGPHPALGVVAQRAIRAAAADREVEVVGQVAGVVDVADIVRQRARRRGYPSDGVVD